MIIITGAAGFIASCVVAGLASKGHRSLVFVDDFSRKEKEANYVGKPCIVLVEREWLIDFMQDHVSEIEFVLHLGARTDTAEMNWNVFLELNL